MDSFRGLAFMTETWHDMAAGKAQSSHLYEQDADRSTLGVMESFETANPIPSDTSSNKTTHPNPFQIVPSTETKRLKLWAYGAIFLQSITARKQKEMNRGGQLTLSSLLLLCSLGLQPSGWCRPHLGWAFWPELTYCRHSLTETSRSLCLRWF